MKGSYASPSYRWFQCTRALSLLLFIASCSLHAQEGVLTLLQFEKGRTNSPKAAELSVTRSTPCQVVAIDEGSVIRCQCPLGFTATQLGTPQEKDAFRALGSTQLHMDGSATFDGLAPFPIFHDSGDPVADDDRYTAWKNAWVAAFPERYAARSLNPLETTVR